MFIYQVRIRTKPYKTDEFEESMRSFSCNIREIDDCMGYRLYRDSEDENTFCIIGEWATRQAMEEHFGTCDFKLLVGAARVLSKTFDISLAKVIRRGGFELAKEHLPKTEE